MSNKEAAENLSRIYCLVNNCRSNNKLETRRKYNEALLKAIKILTETPDATETDPIMKQ